VKESKIRAVLLLVTLAVTCASGCASGDTRAKGSVRAKDALPAERVYTARDVERAFAAERLRLYSPLPQYAGVTWLFAKNKESSPSPDFSVSVFPPKNVSGEIGLRIQPSTHDRMIRLRNVVVSYASMSSSAARVKAAMARLHRM